MNKNDTSKYVFCYARGQPETLVMLEKPERLPQMIFNIGEQTMFVWVVDGAPLDVFHSIKQTQKQIQKYIFVKKDLAQLERDIRQKRTASNLLVIYSPQIYKQIMQFKEKFTQIKKLICYTTDQNFHSNSQIDSLIRDDRKTLIKWLSHFKGNSHMEKILPNFVFLNSDTHSQAEISNNLMITMYAMLNQKIGKQSKNMIIDELQKAVSMIQQINKTYKSSQKLTRQFFHELRNEMSDKSAINWYTRQSVVNRLTNNLLRSTRRSTEIFYLLPYFTVLFHAIESIYGANNQQVSGLKCYRGGKITEEELKIFENNKNSKKIVQNLGFLSTSTNYEVAESFSDNVIFEIQIQEGIKSSLNHRYAKISQYSEYFIESEIIFNPLNLFEILSVSEIKESKNKYKICLKYKQLSGSTQSRDKETIDDSSQLEIYRKWNIDLKDIATSQLYTFSKKQQIFPGFYEYWAKYFEIIDEQLSTNPKNIELKALKAKSMTKYLMETYETQKLANLKQAIQQNLRLFQQAAAQKDLLYFQCLEILGKALFHNSNYRQAIQIFKICLEKRKDNFGEQSKPYFTSLVNLSVAYNYEGKYSQAYKLLKQAKKIGLTKFGPLSGDYISVEVKQANLLSNLGYKKQAIEIYCKYMGLLRKSKGEHNYNYLNILRNLSIEYMSEGRFEEALQLQKKCVQIRLKIQGSQHPQYLESLSNLACTYSNIGRSQMSISIFKKVLQNLKQIYGEQHAEIAETLLHLGNSLKKLRKYKQAFILFKKCLNLRKKLLGQDHKKYIQSLNNIVQLFQQKGDFRKALQFSFVSLQIIKKNGGQLSLDYIFLLHNIGLIYLGLRNAKISLGFFIKAVKLIQKCSLKQNLIYVTCLTNIAVNLRDEGMVQNSITIFRKCLDIFQQKNKKGDACYFVVLNKLAYAYLLAGEVKQAIEVSNLCISQYRIRRYETQSSQYLETITNLGNAYQIKKMLGKSIKVYESCLFMNNRFLQQNYQYYTSLLNSIGSAYKQKGNLQVAVERLKACYQIAMNIYGLESDFLVKYLQNLASCYFSMGKFHQCSNLYKNFLKKFKFKKANNLKEKQNYLFTLLKLAIIYLEEGRISECLKILKKSKLFRFNDEELMLKFQRERRRIQNFLNRYLIQLEIKARSFKKTRNILLFLREKTSTICSTQMVSQVFFKNFQQLLKCADKANKTHCQFEYLLYGPTKMRIAYLVQNTKKLNRRRGKIQQIKRLYRKNERKFLC